MVARFRTSGGFRTDATWLLVVAAALIVSAGVSNGLGTSGLSDDLPLPDDNGGENFSQTYRYGLSFDVGVARKDLF